MNFTCGGAIQRISDLSAGYGYLGNSSVAVCPSIVLPAAVQDQLDHVIIFWE